jgi:hypothetical protein
MKLISVMSLTDYRDQVRELFEAHSVQIYSETDIVGHSSDTIKEYGWWSFDKSEVSMYSVLFFAVVEDDKAQKIMGTIDDWKNTGDPQHPLRAFQVDVEKMV